MILNDTADSHITNIHINEVLQRARNEQHNDDSFQIYLQKSDIELESIRMQSIK